MLTEIGVIKGTLPYMAPEQARGDSADIDVRADVYALGVILYEMISGRRPYDVARSALIEAVRVICEEKPAPLRQASTTSRVIDPDVETIVGKALEKEADRRYGSAAELAGDLGRFLTSQPILARPPSAAYQMKKLISRHRIPAAMTAVMLVALIGFVIGMSVLYVRAVRAEEEAFRQAETANRSLEFMTGMFEVSDPSEARGNLLTAREVLDAGARRIDLDLADQPVVQATPWRRSRRWRSCTRTRAGPTMRSDCWTTRWSDRFESTGRTAGRLSTSVPSWAGSTRTRVGWRRPSGSTRRRWRRPGNISGRKTATP